MKIVYWVWYCTITILFLSYNKNFINGVLSFSRKKITLESGEISYFVIPRSLRSGFVHGDKVRARIIRRGSSSMLAEVELVSLIARSRETLLAKIIHIKWKTHLEILREQWSFRTEALSLPKEFSEGSVVLFHFDIHWVPKIVERFWNANDFDFEERMLFFLSNIRQEFSEKVLEDAEKVKKIFHSSDSRRQKRTDFRDWFTFTIDWADAKDLDDALSISKNKNWNFILAVHIADVAEFVTENSPLDIEAKNEQPVSILQEKLFQCFQRYFLMIFVVFTHEVRNILFLLLWK